MRNWSNYSNGGYHYTWDRCCRSVKSCKRLSVNKKRIRQKKGIRIILSHGDDEYDEKGPSDYAIYCIVNTGFFTNRGNLAESVARAFLKLYLKLDKSSVKAELLTKWEDCGEKLVILKGKSHRHLKYLAMDVKRKEVGEMYPLYRWWGKFKLFLVLAVIGREEKLDLVLDGLTYLK